MGDETTPAHGTCPLWPGVKGLQKILVYEWQATEVGPVSELRETLEDPSIFSEIKGDAWLLERYGPGTFVLIPKRDGAQFASKPRKMYVGQAAGASRLVPGGGGYGGGGGVSNVRDLLAIMAEGRAEARDAWARLATQTREDSRGQLEFVGKVLEGLNGGGKSDAFTSYLTSRVASLEAEVNTLRRERDEARDKLARHDREGYGELLREASPRLFRLVDRYLEGGSRRRLVRGAVERPAAEPSRAADRPPRASADGLDQVASATLDELVKGLPPLEEIRRHVEGGGVVGEADLFALVRLWQGGKLPAPYVEFVLRALGSGAP